MLKVLRKKRQSLLVAAPIGAIVVVFVSWGIGTVVADRVDVVARVNHEVISGAELRHALENLERSYRNLSPNSIPPEALRAQALDQLITSRLLTQEARRLGLTTGDEELRESIAGLPSFQVGGRFDKQAYLGTLSANRIKPADFEEAQRTQLLIMKVQDVIAAGAHVTEAEVKERFRYENERVNLRFIKVPPANFTAQVQVAEGDLAPYLAAHQDTFREPERVRIQYLHFEAKSFADQVNPTDDEIQAYYDAHPDEFRTPEEVHARHILFKVQPGATGEQRDAVRQRAAAVLAQVQAGGDFAALATQYSEDSSAQNGGDLGWFGRGKMVPAFDAAAFALAAGGTSDLVTTPFGFHIIRVEDKHPDRLQPFDQARGAIVDAIRKQRSREVALQSAEQAYEQLADRKASFEDVTRSSGLTARTPPPFSRDEPIVGLTSSAELIGAIFKTEPGDTGEIVTLESGYVVFQVNERIASVVPEIGAIRDRVEAAIRQERAEAAARAHAEEMLKRLQESRDLDALAAAEHLTVGETGPVGRRGAFVPQIGPAQDLKDAAFQLTPAGSVLPAVYSANGEAVIAVLKERVPADEQKFKEQEKSLVEQSRRQLETALVQQFINHLKGQAEIEISPNYAG